MESPRWVNEKVVSEMVGLSLQTLRNRRFMGEGPVYSKLGRAVRYKISDIIKFAEARKVVPQSER